MAINKNRRRNEPNYCSYIHKVLKKVHPELSIQQKTMVSVNSLVENLIKRMTEKSALTAVAAKKGTLQTRHVQTAARLLMPDKLANHAVSEGTKAVTLFTR